MLYYSNNMHQFLIFFNKKLFFCGSSVRHYTYFLLYWEHAQHFLNEQILLLYILR